MSSFVYTGKRLINPDQIADIKIVERQDLALKAGRVLALDLTMAWGETWSLDRDESMWLFDSLVVFINWKSEEQAEWIGRLQG